MPADFDACVAKGGRVITKDIGLDKYMYICYYLGKAHAGEVRTKKAAAKPKKK